MTLRRLLFAAPLLALSSLALADPSPVCEGRDLFESPNVKPDWKAHADDLVNGVGLLWTIEKPGLPPSYLYGTIHSTNDGAIALAREALKYMDGATAAATELGLMESEQKVELGSRMLKQALSPDVDTYVGAIPEAKVADVEATFAAHGLPAVMTHHLKLWMLAVSSALPGCEVKGQQLGLPEVDDLIAATAKAKNVPVVGLESVDEQIATLASTPDSLAAQMLIATARDPELNDDGYVTLLHRYLAKRPSSAIAILDASPDLTPEERAAEAEFTRRLLVGRNEIMLARARPLLDKGGAFIAVGALHLVGKNGLVELTRGAGYQVTKVW